MRTFVLLLAAIGTLAEAVVFGWGLYVVGLMIGEYSMSMGGMPAARGQIAVWVLATVLALILAAPVAPLVLAGVRGRPLRRRARGLIVAALVVQTLLGAFAEVAAGALAVVGVLAVLGLLLLALFTEPAANGAPAAA